MPSPRYRHGLVIGKFYPLHAGHSRLIREAQRACERVTVEVLASSVESIPGDVRAEWVREDHPTARVVWGLDDLPIDYEDPALWDGHMQLMESLLDEPVDAVFTSDAYGEEMARRLGAEWVQVDAGRGEIPVSGTAIRGDLAAHWGELSSAVRASLAARVVVLGAESTGSTTLAAALADALGTAWVPEYGRDYTVTRPGGLEAPWTSPEFELVVAAQIAWEGAALRSVPTPILVCDTDVLATALWHERYVGEAAPRILSRAAQHRPALYVLTGDEIPFVQDGTRDGEHIRHAMQQRFRDTLAEAGVPWVEVTGSVEERVAASLAHIDRVVLPGLRFAPPLG